MRIFAILLALAALSGCKPEDRSINQPGLEQLAPIAEELDIEEDKPAPVVIEVVPVVKDPIDPYVVVNPSPITVAPVITPEPPEPTAPLPKIPDRAVELMPSVIQAIDDIWPDMPQRSYFPAQIEAESCITLTHSKCWNPRAELKTSREYGFGLGQITIAYNANGTERFNVFTEVKRQHPDLKNWAWEDRYNPLLQIKAIVVKNKVNWNSIKWETADLDNKMAFLATFYNGGSPAKDRTLCINTAGCDPSKWWGNVELYSTKSKVKLKEYGNRSLFEISREYPTKVLRTKRPKYIPYTGT